MPSSAVDVLPHSSTKRSMNDQSYRFKNKRQRRIEKQAKPGPTDDVLLTDVQSLLKSLSLANDISNHGSEPTKLPELQSEVELTVSEISSTGDALAYHDASGHVYVVPFAVPGDVVIAKVFKHVKDYSYSLADFVKLVEPSSRRDDSLIRCPYFSKCSGCQFQMLPYSDQLAHKKTIVEKAYRNFSGLDPHLVPSVGDTIGSPLEYGYRTKLTPHFDGPPGGRRDRRNNVKPKWSEVPPIGFMKKGTRSTLDIEDCPIGTDAVRAGMKRERQRVAENIDSYLRGATLLLRENTERKPKPSGDQPADALPGDAVVEDRGEYLHVKTCMTDSNATTTEYIDDHVFQNPAGAFFQNNNSILPVFTQYIRDHILPKTPASRPITNLIDAYSGSGLFTITLSSMFKRSLGIDISASSIASATKNARLNNLPPEHASFIAADASDLFASITFPADETVVVIDPPRKGCDEGFLTQLLQYSPARVVYVSCNVHTQARDIGALVGGMEGVDGGMGMGKGVFEIESLTGFDFFPQTGHVEGVAVLRKKSEITES